MTKLDYTIEDVQERKKIVEQILEEIKEPSPFYLKILADYLILDVGAKNKKRQKKEILTKNRMVTINKRECSFEGLATKFENGEDGIYNIIANDKNIIFQHKQQITQKDLELVPGLKDLVDTINLMEEQLKNAKGKSAYLLKQAIIEKRKEQYVLKRSYYQPISANKCKLKCDAKIRLDDEVIIDENGNCTPKGVSFLDPAVCSAILCNYEVLKIAGEGNFDSDVWFMMEDFDDVFHRALKDYPLLQRLSNYKIQKLSNKEIQDKLKEEFSCVYTVEYLSCLWRNKIPKLIASLAEEDYLDWYFLVKEKGKYKKCSRCGKIKLANNKFFSRNKTSSDGYYSMCKECRNNKNK